MYNGKTITNMRNLAGKWAKTLLDMNEWYRLCKYYVGDSKTNQNDKM